MLIKSKIDDSKSHLFFAKNSIMNIINIPYIYILLLLMKNIIQSIFILVVISFFLIGNIIFAQPDEEPEENGITYSGACLKWMWRWCFDYEKMIWIDKTQNQNITAKSIVQDVLLSATYMVWTVLTIVIIYCGLMYIFAARDWKDPSKYKTWLISAAIWAVLVRWAYTIVRLIQYIAKW